MRRIQEDSQDEIYWLIRANEELQNEVEMFLHSSTLKSSAKEEEHIAEHST